MKLPEEIKAEIKRLIDNKYNFVSQDENYSGDLVDYYDEWSAENTLEEFALFILNLKETK